MLSGSAPRGDSWDRFSCRSACSLLTALPVPAERFFSNVVGLELAEVRTDDARMRLPFRSELCQAEVRAEATGDVVAEGWMTYKVSAPRKLEPS